MVSRQNLELARCLLQAQHLLPWEWIWACLVYTTVYEFCFSFPEQDPLHAFTQAHNSCHAERFSWNNLTGTSNRCNHLMSTCVICARWTFDISTSRRLDAMLVPLLRRKAVTTWFYWVLEMKAPKRAPCSRSPETVRPYVQTATFKRVRKMQTSIEKWQNMCKLIFSWPGPGPSFHAKIWHQIHRFIVDLWMPLLARSSWGGGTSPRRTMSCRHGAESCAGVDEPGIQEISCSLMVACHLWKINARLGWGASCSIFVGNVPYDVQDLDLTTEWSK